MADEQPIKIQPKGRSRHEELIGKQFGEWTVLDFAGYFGVNNSPHMRCKCSCNIIKNVYVYSLLRGTSTNCGHKINLVGQQFGKWTVLECVGSIKKDHDTYWKCKCICNTIKNVAERSLKNGTSKSCGRHREPHHEDLTGQQFGEWTVLEYVGFKNGSTVWKCRCSCNIIRDVVAGRLKNGTSQSCGHTVLKDITGKKFGDLFVLNFDCYDNFKPRWICKCSCGDINSYYQSNLISGHTTSCGHGRGTSNLEKTIINFIESLGFKPIHDRTAIYPKELDIYLPEQKLAIEFNGTYYHSENNGKDKNYHLIKTLLCNKKGIDLIHIFEHEWRNELQQEKLKELIKSRLNVDQTIVYARNTNAQFITDKNYIKNFLEQYHLQGHINFQTAVGLYYNGELVQVMTFGAPRFNKDYDIELLRLCTKAGYKIIGGASKLFKHYISFYANQSIVSYCDISKFNGKVYEQIGMKYDGATDPSYVYVQKHNSTEVLSRFQCQKHKLLEKGWGTEDETETQIMTKHDYLKIYDCGTKRYVYRPSSINKV